MGAEPAAAAQFRRSPHLVLFWRDQELMLHNYAVRRTVPAHGLVLDILRQFGIWRTPESYLATVEDGVREGLAHLLGELHRLRFLTRRDERQPQAELGMDGWGEWNPAAGFFHASSKEVAFIDLESHLDQLAEQARGWPMPSAVKEYPDAVQVPLPAAITRGAFPGVLRNRRTWRQFARRSVKPGELATLLQLSAGVQRWATAEGEGRIALKTSPSGGARHPIESYVVVRNVATVAPGIYHYAAGSHRLERISRRRPPRFDVLLPTQWWYRDAAALVFFTAVFERTRWRYNSPRAYRAVLVEAGHVCQTFCLTATWLGLAPFCSMALDDERIERMLGLDGVSESVVYAAGVGARPALPANSLPGTMPSKRRARR